MEGFILMGFVWVIYILFLLPFYIRREKKNGRVEAVKYKLALSGVFCTIGLFAVLRQNAGTFSILIFLALVFSMIGDYYLVFIKTDMSKFIKGVLSFSVAQVFYITAMVVVEGFDVMEFVITAVLIIPCLIGKYKMKPDMGKATIPLTCYFTLVTFMAVKAVLMAFQQNAPLTQQELFSAGALLFLISDSLLGTWRFITSKQIFSNMVSICYFIGQLMIATAIFFQG